MDILKSETLMSCRETNSSQRVLGMNILRAVMPDIGQKVDEYWKSVFSAQEERFLMFTKLLLKVWKVSTDSGAFCYIYPYQANSENHCVFCLRSNMKLYGYIQDAGVSEHVIHTDEWMITSNLYFEEVELSEMMKNAQDSCEIVFYERLDKLKKRGFINDDLTPAAHETDKE